MDWTADFKAIMEDSKKPQYPHDCKTCKFMGRAGKFDVYVCPQPDSNMDSLIARYGKEGDYYSSPRAVFSRAVSAVILGEVGDGRGGRIKNPKLLDVEIAIFLRVFAGKEDK